MESSWVKYSLIAVGGVLVATGAGFAAAIAFGTSPPPEPLGSVAAPMGKVDYSDMPEPVRFRARDSATLSYRVYPHDGDQVAVHELMDGEGLAYRGSYLFPSAVCLHTSCRNRMHAKPATLPGRP